jgi:hypothetical protein
MFDDLIEESVRKLIIEIRKSQNNKLKKEFGRDEDSSFICGDDNDHGYSIHECKSCKILTRK